MTIAARSRRMRPPGRSVIQQSPVPGHLDAISPRIPERPTTHGQTAPQPRARHWVALVVFVVGVAWLALALVGLSGQVNSFQRMADPGTGAISLAHSGDYVAYYEGPGAGAGNVPAGSVIVTPPSRSAAVQSTTPYAGSVAYSFGSRGGRAILSLQIACPARRR